MSYQLRGLSFPDSELRYREPQPAASKNTKMAARAQADPVVQDHNLLRPVLHYPAADKQQRLHLHLA